MGKNLNLPTKRQIQVLVAVRTSELKGVSPTLEELAANLDCSPSAVYKVLEKLKAAELVSKTKAHRSLGTTRRGKLVAAAANVPNRFPPSKMEPEKVVTERRQHA